MTTPFVIGVAGGTGSGKTTVATRLLELAGPGQSAHLAHDNYYWPQSELPLSQREQTNYDHPDSLETSLLVEHLNHLKQGRGVDQPTYDFAHHTRAATTVRVEPAPIIIVEGILLLAVAELRPLLDLKIFVDTDADVRFIRQFQRDTSDRGRSPDSVINQYLTTVRPMHLEFVEPSKRFADIIIPEGGYNQQALNVLAARLWQLTTLQST